MGRKINKKVHQFFIYNSIENKSACKVCGVKLSGTHSTNLKRHLTSKHGEIFKDCDSEEVSETQAVKKRTISFETSEDTIINSLINVTTEAEKLKQLMTEVVVKTESEDLSTNEAREKRKNSIDDSTYEDEVEKRKQKRKEYDKRYREKHPHKSDLAKQANKDYCKRYRDKQRTLNLLSTDQTFVQQSVPPRIAGPFTRDNTVEFNEESCNDDASTQASTPIGKSSRKRATNTDIGSLLQEEKLELIKAQRTFYEQENLRAQEKHMEEMETLSAKRELLYLEIAEKKRKLNQDSLKE